MSCQELLAQVGGDVTQRVLEEKLFEHIENASFDVGAQGGVGGDQVIPTPSHLLDHISPIFPPFFPVFCAFSPPRRDGSNEPQAGTQGQETAGTRTKRGELPLRSTPKMQWEGSPAVLLGHIVQRHDNCSSSSFETCPVA